MKPDQVVQPDLFAPETPVVKFTTTPKPQAEVRPRKAKNKEVDKRLKDLLHHFEGTKGRWYRLQQFGAIDDALKEAIADEIGILLALPALEGLTSALPPSPCS